MSADWITARWWGTVNTLVGVAMWIAGGYFGAPITTIAGVAVCTLALLDWEDGRGITGTMPGMKGGPHGPSIKKANTYEALRRKGMSKTKAARISNAQANGTINHKGGRRKGRRK